MFTIPAMTSHSDLPEENERTSSPDPEQSGEELSLSARLHNETGYLGWSDLVRFFARGVVIRVDPSLDLVEVGECMTSDDALQLQQWTEAGLVARASDDDARRWTVGNPTFRALVTAPWVLVQEKVLGV